MLCTGPLGPQDGQLLEVLHQLPRPQREDLQGQVPHLGGGRAPRRATLCLLLHEAGLAFWLSLGAHAPRRHQRDGVPHSLGAL